MYARIVAEERLLGTLCSRRALVWTSRAETVLSITRMVAVILSLGCWLVPSRTGAQLARELVCCHP